MLRMYVILEWIFQILTKLSEAKFQHVSMNCLNDWHVFELLGTMEAK